MKNYFKTRRKQLFLWCCILILYGYLAYTYSNPKTKHYENRCFRRPGHPKKTYTFKRKTIINHFRFSYPINIADACSKRPIKLLIPVHSAITNFQRRDSMRKQQQGLFAKDPANEALLLFFVGLPSPKITHLSHYQARLEEESRKFGDIVQINTTDAYRNIVQKAMAVLNWISEYCAESQFVLKLDDDVIVDPSPLIVTLRRRRKECAHFIIGEIRLGRKVHRSKDSKWYMPYSEFPYSNYPPFVMGLVTAYPTATAVALYQQAMRTRLIWLDDVFITGICRQKLGIPLVNDYQFTLHSGHNMDAPKPPDFVYQ